MSLAKSEPLDQIETTFAHSWLVTLLRDLARLGCCAFAVPHPSFRSPAYDQTWTAKSHFQRGCYMLFNDFLRFSHSRSYMPSESPIAWRFDERQKFAVRRPHRQLSGARFDNISRATVQLSICSLYRWSQTSCRTTNLSICRYLKRARPADAPGVQ